jgi:hypothetical protein
VWFNTRNMYIWGHVVSVVVFGGGSTFIIAYAKAHFNRPTVNVGKYLEALCWKEDRSRFMILLLTHWLFARPLTSLHPIAHHDLGDPHQGGYTYVDRIQYDESSGHHHIHANRCPDIDDDMYLSLARERA